jgi:hypothetical protein
MPVNEYMDDEPVVQSKTDEVVRVVKATAGVTNTLTLRVVVLFLVAMVCVALAPMPANLIGVAAVCLLALDTAAHRR